MGRPSDGRREAWTPDLIIHINHAFEGSMDPLWDWQLTQQLGNQGGGQPGGEEGRIGILAKKWKHNLGLFYHISCFLLTQTWEMILVEMRGFSFLPG